MEKCTEIGIPKIDGSNLLIAMNVVMVCVFAIDFINIFIRFFVLIR